MRNVTILNTDGQRLVVISWKKAIKLLLKGKVIPIDYYEDCELILINKDTVLIPRTMVLREYVKVPLRTAKPSRRSIFARDNYTCVYCKRQLNGDELSIDHVIPRSRGGPNTVENLATACKKCNNKKGDRTPAEWRRNP